MTVADHIIMLHPWTLPIFEWGTLAVMVVFPLILLPMLAKAGKQ